MKRVMREIWKSKNSTGIPKMQRRKFDPTLDPTWVIFEGKVTRAWISGHRANRFSPRRHFNQFDSFKGHDQLADLGVDWLFDPTPDPHPDRYLTLALSEVEGCTPADEALDVGGHATSASG